MKWLLLSLFVTASLGYNLTAYTNLTCPDDDNKTYSDALDYTYQLHCSIGLEFEGPAEILYGFVQTDQVSTCAEICSKWNLGDSGFDCSLVITFIGRCFLFGGNYSFIAPQGTNNYTAAIVVGKPDPRPPAPINFAANCTSDRGDLEHYTDPEGFTYFTLCGKSSGEYNYTSVAVFDPPNLAGCVKACSERTLACEANSGIECCTGAYYDPTDGSCSLDQNAPARFAEADGDSAYIISRNRNCSYTPGSREYITPEGDYTAVSSLYTSNVRQANSLFNTTQSTPCGCAEQCSLYNRAFPNATRCLGAEFDENPRATPNCFVKSS